MKEKEEIEGKTRKGRGKQRKREYEGTRWESKKMKKKEK